MSKKIKILVIDDDETLRASLGSVLSKDNKVVAAKDGKEGIMLLKKTRPDVILLDIKMPGIDGFKVLRLLKLIDSSMPVIIVSAISSLKTIVDLFKIGANDCIDKPFDVINLKRKVVEAAKAKHSRKKKKKSGMPCDVEQFIKKTAEEAAVENTDLEHAIQGFREKYIDLLMEKALGA